MSLKNTHELEANKDRFFYIDKTTLSYAAIFGIEEDMGLHGSQYSWLR